MIGTPKTAISVCEVRWLGRVPYAEAWESQRALAAEIAAGERQPTLLLLEHPHTFTFGRRGDPEHLLWSQEELRARGVEVHWVDRGGDVTFHGPGQLIGYPLLPLGRLIPGGHVPQGDYVAYLRRLEMVLVVALARLGVVGSRVRGKTGVWIHPAETERSPYCRPAARGRPGKVASIGVKVDANGVSQHGFALNVDPDMSYWEGIIACGLADSAAIALADLVRPVPTIPQVIDAVVEVFGDVFGYRMRET